MTDTIEEKVISILSETLGETDSAITIDSTPEDLGLDSLDEIECIIALELEFDLEIDDYDAERLKSVRQIVDYVAGRVVH